MKSFELLLGLVLAVTMLACGTGGGFDRGREVRREADLRHAEAVDRLVPEDGAMRPARLRAVIEAIRTVRPDIPEDELPVNYRAVRRIMKDMSYAELRRSKRSCRRSKSGAGKEETINSRFLVRLGIGRVTKKVCGGNPSSRERFGACANDSGTEVVALRYMSECDLGS